MSIRTDQNEAAFIELGDFRIGDVHQLQGNAALAGRCQQRIDLEIGSSKPEEDEPLTEEVDDGSSIRKPGAAALPEC